MCMQRELNKLTYRCILIHHSTSSKIMLTIMTHTNTQDLSTFENKNMVYG